MTTSSSRGGASIVARDQTPTIHLEPIARLLAKMIAETKRPFFQFYEDPHLLRINAYHVIHELVSHPDFISTFSPSDHTGLIRDMPSLPPYGTEAKLGGQLLHGSMDSTSRAIDQLYEIIETQLNTHVPADAYAHLTIDSMSNYLQQMAQSIGEKLPVIPTQANITPIAFESNDHKRDRSGDVARLFSAIEVVDGQDWFHKLADGIRRIMEHQDQCEDDIDMVIGSLNLQKDQPNSQIKQFLNFLDDEALSRVRLQVTFGLMNALAMQSKRVGFKAYVSQVQECFEYFSGINGNSCVLDVSSQYGQHNNVNLGDYFASVQTYQRLPVWADWNTQLFETRSEPQHGFNTVREVSYCFKINGNHATTGQPAFINRLNEINESIFNIGSENFSSAGSNLEKTPHIQRFIANLVFLWLVTPTSIDEAPSSSLIDRANELARRIAQQPRNTLTQIYQELVDRQQAMNDVAKELISLLRNKTTQVLDIATKKINQFAIVILPNIINWEAVRSMVDTRAELLKRSPHGNNHSLWFKSIQICKSDEVHGGLASYVVQTQMTERSLTETNQAVTALNLEKDFSASVLPVRLVPYKQIKDTAEPSKKFEPVFSQDLNKIMRSKTGGVELYIWTQSLAFRLTQQMRKDETAHLRAEYLRAASLTAFTVFSYVSLLAIVRKIKGVGISPSMALIRLQNTGKQAKREADAHDGNTALYGISQSLERALSRELPVKVQGIVINPNDNNMRWKQKGMLHALLGGQPLKFPMQGALDKVAVITYATRPCDTHADHPDANGFIFISRTYTATRSGSQSILRFDNMQNQLVRSRDEFKLPPIIDEVNRLQLAGFNHIILLSHHYGNRHIGGAAERHTAHNSVEFLQEINKQFPQVSLYPLRRDVFKATRLRQRQPSESACEVLSFHQHDAMYQAHGKDQQNDRSLLPIYTFATLNVVGDDRPQSGFCTYFYDSTRYLSSLAKTKEIEGEIAGIGGQTGTRESLVSVLRAIHFLESEKIANGKVLAPVLDPFDWVTPKSTTHAGEIAIITRRRGRTVLLCMPAILAHVAKVLYKQEYRHA